jgi:type I restriction enzyme M protein
LVSRSSPGTLGVILRKTQNRIQDPAKLKCLLVDLIDKEQWSATDSDLRVTRANSCSSGEHPTRARARGSTSPRDLIQAIVDVIRPTAHDTVIDPACGTGGFLLVAHDYALQHAADVTSTRRDHLRDSFVHGTELIDGAARLAAMNLLLHGIGTRAPQIRR